MTTNTTLLVTLAKPAEEELEIFQSYVGASTQLAVEAGAEVSSRFALRHLYGDAPATVFGFATFPSSEAVNSMFDSSGYRDLIPARNRGVECVNAYIVDPAPVSSLSEPDGVYLVTVAAPNPDAAEDLAAYQKIAGPMSAKHGAEPVVNLPVSERPVGTTPAAFVGIVKFPSAAAVQAFLEDPDYTASLSIRDRALSSLNLYVTA